MNPDIDEIWLKKRNTQNIRKSFFYKDIIEFYNISKIVYVSANHWHISNKILKEKGDVKSLIVPKKYDIWAKNG